MGALQALVAASHNRDGILVAIHNKDEHQLIHNIFDRIGSRRMCYLAIDGNVRYPFAYRVYTYHQQLATGYDQLRWYQSSSFASLPTYRVSQLIDTIYRRR